MPQQNGHLLADDILKFNFLSQMKLLYFDLKVFSQKFAWSSNPVHKKSALVDIVGWYRNRRQAVILANWVLHKLTGVMDAGLTGDFQLTRRH